MNITISDRIDRMIVQMEQTLPEMQKEMLEEMAAVAEPVAASNLSGAVGSGTKYPSQSTGELAASLGTTPVQPSKSGGGYDIAVGFNEPRRNQTAPKYWKKGKGGSDVAVRGYYTATNAMIANILEHGKSGQAPRPFMGPAKISVRGKCEEAARAVFKKWVKKQ